MGNRASSNKYHDALAYSAAMERQIEEVPMMFRKECKLLLLGLRESGKSTIAKQIKIICQNGFSDRERAYYRPIIYKNLMESAQAVVLAMRKARVSPEEPMNRDNADKIVNYDLDLISSASTYCFPEDLALAAQQLWQDPVIPKFLVNHWSEFHLMDSAPYFFEEAHRIGELDYVSTETDILRSQQKTTVVVDTRFSIGLLSIRMFDLGTQRLEPKGLMRCFEGMTSIVFCTAISEYDQNRMTESLALFESTVNSRWFLQTSVILFMNKMDLFRKKNTKDTMRSFRQSCSELIKSNPGPTGTLLS